MRLMPEVLVCSLMNMSKRGAGTEETRNRHGPQPTHPVEIRVIGEPGKMCGARVPSGTLVPISENAFPSVRSTNFRSSGTIAIQGQLVRLVFPTYTGCWRQARPPMLTPKIRFGVPVWMQQPCKLTQEPGQYGDSFLPGGEHLTQFLLRLDQIGFLLLEGLTQPGKLGFDLCGRCF